MINKKTFTPFMIVITLLATLGLVSTLITSPNQFIKGLLLFSSIILTCILIVFFVRYRRRTKNDELRKYRRAAKQSQKRQRQKSEHLLNNSQYKKVTSIPKKRKANPPHLRVIDGKKTAKNDPMSL
ncbi:MAG TPA: hypothetical protein GXZ58_04575 [Bacilli bacterium]|nr:hypothetical protein [Bacilli bacterium]